jgi:chromosome segregation ATPase
LEKKEQTIESLNEQLKSQKDKSDTQEKELHTFQSKIQKFKSERNSYKQKADSLSKEVSRICRNGRTLADVERILANEATLKEEVELLRKQKRKALEECHSYRKSYEQNRAAQELIAASPNKSKSNPQHDATSIMERNLELERVVTELTEYVNAKEMQLETLMQVNKTLQEEIHGLAQANMNTNEV